jgi:hypothetical protein
MRRRAVRVSGATVVLLVTGAVFALASPRSGGPPAQAPQPQSAAPAALPEAVTDCLSCHEDKTLSITLKDGSTKSMYVDMAEVAKSVHGGQLICTDCHEKYDQDHPSDATFESARAYRVKTYETCKRCHFDTYTRTLESVHYGLLKSGSPKAPICVDCHGSHNITDPRARRTMMSRSCAACHTDTFKAYAKSVHGRAMVEDDNQDVPACADCHTHHEVQQPGTTAFRLAAPDTCVRCHGNESLMSKYGVSTMVAKTYLADFHGVTASLSRNLKTADHQVVVTCNDCHGVHDIASPRLRGAKAMQATVTATCQSCHKGMPATFPAAWLSHYPPSPRHAPLVWAVGVFYKFFIPFAVVGLCLHLLLQGYRMASGR